MHRIREGWQRGLTISYGAIFVVLAPSLLAAAVYFPLILRGAPKGIAIMAALVAFGLAITFFLRVVSAAPNLGQTDIIRRQSARSDDTHLRGRAAGFFGAYIEFLFTNVF